MGVFGFESEHDATEMQRTKQISTNTSSNRLTIVPKKLWRSRAKSQTRVPTHNTCNWIPEGNCRWKTENGHRVTLTSINLLALSEIERLAIQQMALTKLRAMNLNCRIDIPKIDSSILQKVKRRPILLRNKARTASCDGREKKDREIPSEKMVFGVPLQQCIQNDRLLRHRGSMQPLTGTEDRLSSSPPQDDCLGATSSGNTLFVDNQPNKQEYEVHNWNLESLEPQIPNVVNACFRHLEEYGLHTLGLFRVTSSKRRVRQLREDLENGQIVDLNENHNPHDVAQLLKEYFRDLPEPLLTRDLYPAFMAALRQRDVNKQLDIFRYLIYLLPVQNRDTLWALLNFLSNVAQNATDTQNIDGDWQCGNRMNSMNLATLFGPNILHVSQKGNRDREYIVERTYRPDICGDIILIVQKLIDNYKTLFMIPADDLDSTYRRLIVEDPEALQTLLKRRYLQQLESQDNENQSCTVVQEITIERSKQGDKMTVVLPIITISGDNRNSKSRVLLDNEYNDTMLGPPGFRDESPSLRRKSFPDQITDRSLLMTDVNPSMKTSKFSVNVTENNLLESYNETITTTETTIPEFAYVTSFATEKEIDKAKASNSQNSSMPTKFKFQKETKYLKPKDKFQIEKSASTSSVNTNRNTHEKKDKFSKNKSFRNKQKEQIASYMTNMALKVSNSNTKQEDNTRSRSTQRTVSRGHTATIQCQQERWKRWEIIASEHSQV